jgi:hypothetical protein
MIDLTMSSKDSFIEVIGADEYPMIAGPGYTAFMAGPVFFSSLIACSRAALKIAPRLYRPGDGHTPSFVGSSIPCMSTRRALSNALSPVEEEVVESNLQ